MRVGMSLKGWTAQALMRQLIARRTLRKPILKEVSKRAYRALVEESKYDIPLQVRLDQYDYLMALVAAFDRAVEQRLVGKEVLRKLVGIFIQHVFWESEQKRASAPSDQVVPFFLVISPTGRCNLHCKGCYADSDAASRSSLDFETFERMLNEKAALWGSHFTVISGGEPFLWKDGEHDLLDMAARYPTDLFLVYTNGTLISDEVAVRMAELGNITPAISVEGFEQETDARRGKGVHRRILNAFANLRRHGVPFGISITPTAYNWDLVTSDRFYEFYYTEQGALYGWLFQYMPIGRGVSLQMMVPPRERVEMLRRTQRLVREKKIFVADFWNSGTASNGCICAGRSGGYLYVDWNGDIMPCVFVPYAVGNIHQLYAEGKTLNDILDHPLLVRIRRWQKDYGVGRPAHETGNWLCPCVIRDHFELLREAVCQTGARPINEPARCAISDEAYRKGMTHYDRQMRELTDPIWQEEYLSAHAADACHSVRSTA